MQMRASNELSRLSAAAPGIAQTESLVDAGEEERILERILASSRGSAPVRRLPRRLAVLLVGAVLASAAVAAAIETGGHGKQLGSAPAPRHVALSGARIQLAGYRFRTPAGFKKSTTACASDPSAAHQPTAVLNGFAAAASADGGCVEAAYLIAPSNLGNQGNLIPSAAKSVDVGTYQGYYVPPDSSGKSTLYVGLPKAGGSQNIVYLVLLARELTEEQLIAVAVSGLPG
jgi:hypothetical protein